MLPLLIELNDALLSLPFISRIDESLEFEAVKPVKALDELFRKGDAEAAIFAGETLVMRDEPSESSENDALSSDVEAREGLGAMR